MEEINNGIFITSDIKQNIYVIGDIHGDYQCFIHCLVDLCNVCSITKIYNDVENDYQNREYLSWNELNNSIVIFCGDIIHRKRYSDHVLDDECSDIYMIENIFRLQKEAKENGGKIILITGNHEIMNIVEPSENMYTSKKNLIKNTTFFSDKENVNKLIKNSYAWIKLDDILITHGGLCSNYLDIVDTTIENNDIIKYVNDRYHEYFKDFNNKEINDNNIGFNLFINYDMDNKKHNMFWCREWGYANIDCDKYKEILFKINCKKMIIAHCPQFLSPDKPKMINFECIDNNIYNLARIDLGMSRSFDYNKDNNFINNLRHNYNRKMSVLSLIKNKKLYFNESSIITKQLSCLQYLLLKYGLNKEEWKSKNINSNWIGFNYIDDFIKKITSNTNINTKCNDISTLDENTVVMCLLYPLIKDTITLSSIKTFNKLI